jgi:hypothetical protein
MLGTGVTCAASVGMGTALLGLLGRVAGAVTTREVLQAVGKLSVVTFVVAVLFAGVVALAGRRRRVDQLSLRSIAAFGAAGGGLYFLVIAAANGARVWSFSAALGNLMVLVLIGAGSAVGTLLVARRVRPSLGAAVTPLDVLPEPPAVVLGLAQSVPAPRPPRA